MTSDEIRAAIGRLRQLNSIHVNSINVITALMGDDNWTGSMAKDFLIDLLEQADPDTHVELPTDADCKPIHLGDRIFECHGDMVEHTVEVNYMNLYVNGWVVYDTEGGMHEPRHCFHYHKPTVEEILANFAVAYGSVDGDDRERLVSDCAKLLRLREEDE